MRKLMLILWRMSKADLRLLWFALRHPSRPAWLMPAAVILLLYALAPFNFVLPLVGVVDDMVFVPLVLHFLLKLLPRDIAAAAR